MCSGTFLYVRRTSVGLTKGQLRKRANWSPNRPDSGGPTPEFCLLYPSPANQSNRFPSAPSRAKWRGYGDRRSPEYIIHGLPLEATDESHEDWVNRLHPDHREATVKHFLEELAGSSEDNGPAGCAANRASPARFRCLVRCPASRPSVSAVNLAAERIAAYRSSFCLAGRLV